MSWENRACLGQGWREVEGGRESERREREGGREGKREREGGGGRKEEEEGTNIETDIHRCEKNQWHELDSSAISVGNLGYSSC